MLYFLKFFFFFTKGELFANSFVTESGPNSIERALDSSRYFIIRVEAPDGMEL